MRRLLKRQIIALLAALATVLGIGVLAAPQASASTGYRSATCYVTDGIHTGSTSFHVTS